jgi:hypothetical protein
MDQLPYVPPHVMRFHSLYEFMRNKWMEYDFVVATDVKDVYFQTNPCDDVANRCGYGTVDTYDLIVASEGLKYKDEAWGRENLQQAYGPYVYEHFKENEIFNVGTFGGKSEYVKDMFFNIYTNAIHRPISVCDQAVFNVLINTQPFKDAISYSHDWACELGTVMDPSKIEQFRPNLLFSEPIWNGEQVMIPPMAMRPFPIVHQYDRVPALKEFVQKKYGQDDESQLFVYRT